MQQVLEILCHRERANSVLLLGEPGVGKTAIAEGLARRIEFEPDRVPVRLRDCQIVNLQMNTMVAGHDAARHVRGSDPERHPRDQGAPEPHPVHRRSAHDDRRGLGARRAVGCRQRLQVGARARRGPHHRRDHARANTRSSSRKTKRWRGVSARCTSPSRRIEETRRHSLQPAAAARAQLLGPHLRTRRSRRRSRWRRATCGTCSCPTRSSAGSTPPSVKAEIARRWEVDGPDVVGVISHDRAHPGGHGVPRRHRSLPRHRGAARRRGSSGRTRPSTRWRGGSC